jgi:P-type Ca2+ transporter type 2C
VDVTPAVEIVPGNIFEHEAGDLAPAGARLVETASLKSAEAALTGESWTVSKRAITLDQDDAPVGNRRNMVFMGTSVAAAIGSAVFTAMGMETELGRIAGLLQEASMDEGAPLGGAASTLSRPKHFYAPNTRQQPTLRNDGLRACF